MVKFLEYNKAEVEDNLINKAQKWEDVTFYRGELRAWDTILGLCDFLDTVKIADKTREELERKRKENQFKDVYQADVFSKTLLSGDF